MNHFVIVLTDTCTTEDVRYVVNTSINTFIYRIEIFKNEVFIDAIEVNCLKKYNQEVSNQFFVDKYQQAHKEMRDKYCQVEEAQVSNNKFVIEKKENSFFAYMANTNSLKKIVGGVLVFGIMSYLLTTKIFIYSDLYIDNFLEGQEKITNLSEEKIHTSYIVLPKEDNVEFNLSKAFELKIHNKSNHPIFVTLKDILLDNSNNEEIVQFKEGEISFVLQEEEENFFHIFLEPSYYKQFELGKYTGVLLFDVKYQNRIIGNIKKRFYFMVR